MDPDTQKFIQSAITATTMAAEHRHMLQGRQDVILAALAVLVRLHPNRDVFEAQLQRELEALPMLSTVDGSEGPHKATEMLGRRHAEAKLMARLKPDDSPS